MQLVINTETDGTGFWSDCKKQIPIVRLALVTHKSDIIEGHVLRAYFLEANWNVDELGLIYTDRRWLASFLEGLHFVAGFQWHTLIDNSIMYSEQGMQGYDFVSLDVNEVFVKEWERVVKLAESLG